MNNNRIINGKQDAIIIRPASATDAPAICQLRQILWFSTYSNPEYQATLQRQDFTSQQQIDTYIASISGGVHFHLVAEKKQQLIAWAAVELLKNEIIALYVMQDEQGQGLGRKLYQLLLKKLDSSKTIGIYTVCGNQRAIDFYRKNNFIITQQPDQAQIAQGLKNHQLPLLKMELVI